MQPKKQRVFLVDDHPIVRQGLALMINQEPDLIVCGTAADTRSAIESAPKANPHIVVTDISMAGPDGLELIKSLLVLIPKLQILVLSMHDEVIYAERALRAGARGYIMKHEAESNIISAIRCILRGDVYFSPGITNQLLNKFRGQSATTTPTSMQDLSNRELQIFDLLGRGKRTREIADDLSIGIKTVETHIMRIRHKLNLRSSREVARQAALWIQLTSGA